MGSRANRQMGRTLKALAIVLVLWGVGAAYIYVRAALDNSAVESSTVVAAADSLIPASSLSDWVSYSDAVATIYVTAEQQGDAVKDAGGSYPIPRTVSAKVEAVLWSTPFERRPKLVDGTEISFGTAGWWVNDAGTHQLAVDGDDRLEVGSTYLVALFYDDRGVLGPVAWKPLGVGAVRAVDDGVATVDGVQVKLGSAGALLVGTEADEVATSHGDLDPVSRVEAVVRDTEGSVEETTD